MTHSQQADVVVLAVGEGPEAEVLGDIDDLTISPSQIELIKTVHGVCLGPQSTNPMLDELAPHCG